MRRKPQITKASRRTNCNKIHVTKAEYQEKLMKMEEPYIQVIEKKVIKTKVENAVKSKCQKLHKRAYWSCTAITQLAERLFKAIHRS